MYLTIIICFGEISTEDTLKLKLKYKVFFMTDSNTWIVEKLFFFMF